MQSPTTQISLWGRIEVGTTNTSMLYWAVADESNCAAASQNKTNYACASEHSTCSDDYTVSPSYLCICEDGYFGNPYYQVAAPVTEDIIQLDRRRIVKDHEATSAFHFHLA